MALRSCTLRLGRGCLSKFATLALARSRLLLLGPPPRDRWRFFVWDSERTMLGSNDNTTTKNLADRATAIHQNLLAIPEYRDRFSGRAQLHLGPGGVLSPAEVEAEFLGWVALLGEPLLGESARWGDAHRPDNPYTVNGAWQTEINARLEGYFPGRTETVLQQLAAQDL